MAADLASALLSAAGPSEKQAEESKAGDDGDMALVVASEDAIAAIKRDDAKAFSKALRAWFTISESQPHDEYDEE